MSYGWLTESSILPNKSKKIDVHSKTFIDLKVNLLKEKEKLKSNKNDDLNMFLGKKHEKIQINNTKFNFKNSEFSKPREKEHSKNIDKKTNNYVDDFVHNDNPELSHEQMQAKLLEKQKLYDRYRREKFGENEKTELLLNENILIDFGYKKINNLDKTKENNHKRKTKFDIGPETNQIDKHMDKDEENSFYYNTPFVELNEKLKVKQSYDKKLTELEKDNLEKIIDEENDFKEKMNFMKRKKELERLERIERIKSISFPKE